MADNVDKEKNTEQQDYYQFQHINLKNYDIDATIMIPDATAGIGASFKPQIHHIPGDYKWHIQIGRSFNLQIEDFGDNAYRYAEMRKKIFQNKAFRVSIVKEDIDQVLYERVLDNSYHIYAVKKIDDVYYELKSMEKGDSRKIAEFIFRSVKSFKERKNGIKS